MSFLLRYTFYMNKQVKRLWLDALKSRKYPQGKGRLKRGDSFCCLGVLCELSILHHNTSSTLGRSCKPKRKRVQIQQ